VNIPNDRIILHCDLNNFYASVECLKNPHLKGPVAVSGDPQKRHGVILAKNEEAKKFSIKTGDTVLEALRKCPSLTLVKTNFEDYDKYSKMVFRIYERFTDKVEPFGADECWLDCTHSTMLFGDGEKIANTIRDTVKKEIGLTLSVGVSFTKTFAKLGSDLKKPDATTVISRQNYKQIAWPLPASNMLMVGKKTEQKLKKLGIFTIGELATADEDFLHSVFGINGVKIKLAALGEDNDEVRKSFIERENKSYGHGMTTLKDVCDIDSAKAVILYLAEKVAKRLSEAGVKGKGISLGIRFNDLTRASKHTKLNTAVFSAVEIAESCFQILPKIWNKKPIRSFTVSVFDVSHNQQISFFDGESHQKNENLELALEKIRKKYGKDKIRIANIVESDFIYDKNDSEDFLPFKR